MRRLLERLKGGWKRPLLITLGTAACLALATFAVLLAVDQQGTSAGRPSSRPETSGPDAGAPNASHTIEFQVNDDIPEEVPDAIAATMRRSVVVYQIKEDDVQYGTGFILRDGIVVTAAHIIDDTVANVAVVCDKTEQPARVAAYDRVRDVAVLEAKCAAPMARFSKGNPGLYDQLLITGYRFLRTDPSTIAARRFAVLTAAIPAARLERMRQIDDDEQVQDILAKMRERKLPRLRAISGAAEPGQSGSLVINGNGAVVGMIVLIVPFHQRTFYVPANSIRNMLLREWIIP